jgi:hypothetical protein
MADKSEPEPTPQPPHGVFIVLLRGRFFWLLASLVALILIVGETPPTAAPRMESVLPFAAVIAGATYAARGGKKLLLTTLLCSALFIAAWIAYLLRPGGVNMLLCLFALLACLAIAFLCTLGFVLRAGAVTADHIMGAISAYALLAMFFATVYNVLWLVDPASFKGLESPTLRPWADLFYFSCTTLSTVGYGDIIPANSRSRSVAIVEMMTGTFYVAVLIARLANLYPPPARRQRPASTLEPSEHS